MGYVRCVLKAACLALAGLSSSWSQAVPPADLPDVTVTAPRPPSPQELAGDAVPNFIKSHATPSQVLHQLTRWQTGICPVTQGLSAGYDAYVSARIEAVAAAVGAPREESASCKHNVYIVFATEPQKVLDALVKQNAALLGFHYAHQTRALATVSRPIQGWYVTATRNYRGVETIDDPLPLPSLPGIFNAGKVAAGEPGSRLTNGRSSLIVSALIVVDTTKVAGMTIGSIADYLAVMVLSQAQSPEGCGQLASIIDLMATTCGGRDKPSQITAGDIAFLRGLYSTDLEQPVSLENSDIQVKMMREFGGR